MKLLGLDLGTKTLGMAVSDPLEIIATPVGTIHFAERDLAFALNETEKIIREKGIQKIVLGLPKHMSGDVGTLGDYVYEFKKMLEDKLQLEVVLIDERLTSKLANQTMLLADLSRQKRKTKVDKIAATFILQTYLDMKKK
ncbi:MAG TPA: Holliday junction resolvase RuvX [Bacilli bacterium]|nr:MAG: putative Holliday junction resolvase [Tenericutes bacterium ADurb.BinA124]HNZ50240.1 Holliday junction resolvase RuvX [Bacilli bacterium]HPN60665.1 Holliday junction resolvase RuvX [Bacilli bacterium]HPX84903.1 Holliday junction resolvase RuvX [Bacilli bacterium]HQC74901.1 Holliday junction resolvase RuvX [Bacilli bacterium]